MRHFLSLGLGLLCLSLTAANAGFFSVDSAGDEGDAIPGDGVCSNSVGDCTLRAAIQEANANSNASATNTIHFSGALTIDITADLPPILNPVSIVGVGVIEIVGHGNNGLDVRGGNSEISGLIINGCSSGIILRDKGGNDVRDCFLGTDVAGEVARPNSNYGLLISDSPDNRVRGLGTPGVISGNFSDGVRIEGSTSTGNVFENLRIGTDLSGSNAVGNVGNGIHVVGGNLAIGSCVISANVKNGVLVENAGPFSPQESFIGTDSTGTRALGNELSGIVISNGPECHIGGGGVAPMVVSANGRYGIELLGSGTTSNQVGFGRVFLGAGLNTNALGNTLGGVLINGASGNVIDAATPFNLIFLGFNGGPGVTILSGTNNSIGTGVSFLSNAGLGIDLGGDGSTTNDLLDADDGADHRMNHPVLTNVTVTATNTTISGTLNSLPNSFLIVECYASSVCDYPQGETFLGLTLAFTDGSGNDGFSLSITNLLADGTFVTALTRHDPAFSFLQQNVSEFAPCFPVGTSACQLTCPDDITTNLPSGQTNMVVQYPAPTTTGSCGPVVSDPPSGSIFPVGTNLVTSTSVNNGTTNTCTFKIIVQQPDFSIQAQVVPGSCTNTSKGDSCPVSGSVLLQNNGQTYFDMNLLLTQTCKTKNGIAKCKLQGTIVVNELNLSIVPDHSIAFYLSDDGNFDPSTDTLLYTADIDLASRVLSKAVQKNKPIPVKCKVPKNANLSGKFLIIAVDPLNEISETAENNNNAVVGPLP